jgi:hypothetical protein
MVKLTRCIATNIDGKRCKHKSILDTNIRWKCFNHQIDYDTKIME